MYHVLLIYVLFTHPCKIYQSLGLKPDICGPLFPVITLIPMLDNFILGFVYTYLLKCNLYVKCTKFMCSVR